MSNPHHEPQPSGPELYQPSPAAPPTGYEPPRPGQMTPPDYDPTAGHQTPRSQEAPSGYQEPYAAGHSGYQPPGAYQASAVAPWPSAYELPGAYQPTPAPLGQSGYQSPAGHQTPGFYDPLPAYQPAPAYGVPPPAGYAMPQPYYPYPYMPPREHEGLAIASLVVSCAAVLGLCTSGFAGVLGIVGAILGHVARSRIKRNGRAGGGLALAGIIVGWVLTAVCAVLATVMIVMLVHDSDPYGTPV